VNNLPGAFDKFVALAKQPIIREALDYYYGFTKLLNPKLSEEKIKFQYLEEIFSNSDSLIEVFELKKKN